MSKERSLPVIARSALSALNTKQLLGRLRRLHECPDTYVGSDRYYDGLPANLPGRILFKVSTEWQEAYADVKAVLSTREHVPGGSERREARLARAKRNKIGRGSRR